MAEQIEVFILNKKRIIRSKAIESISDDAISRYMPYLSGNEIYDIVSGDCVGMGIFNSKTDEVLGLSVVRILPRYIRIEKIFTVERYRKLDVATDLLLSITDTPKEANLPIYVIVPEGEADENWMQKEGFTKKASDFTYVTIPLKAMDDLCPPEEKNVKALINEKIPADRLKKFIKNAGYDEILQFPGFIEDVKTEDCIALEKDGNLVAALFFDELDDYIVVRWMHSIDDEYAEYLISALQKVLLTEYRPEVEVRFLVANQGGTELFRSLFEECKITKINLFSVRN